tara:strand:- start:2 stop:451 length:450 start_codon:yes stop_codon:yes gene_type:complete
MIKVYQTIVDPGKGNCMQAVVASLFEKDIQEIPNFINFGTQWWPEIYNYYNCNGYNGIGCLDPKGRIELTKRALEFDGGVNGFWAAFVPSQTFKDSSHAVIIDKDLNIVHDPNPNQKALLLGPEDITKIDIVHPGWYIDGDVLVIGPND